ncbi:MAG: ROK family protein [Candidatus Orphnella occulta]|nr:ROK family protein [Candidatus Orphnella occulta]
MKIKNRILAIDFGATFVKFGLLNLKGEILKKGSFSTKAHLSRKSLVSRIITESELMITGLKKSLLGVGIGVPGPVDYKKGVIYNLTNVKGWRGVPLRDIIRSQLKVPVFVDNDANAACIGEAKWGAAKGFKDVVCITLGSGLGSAVMIDGKIFRGRGYSAAEMGHMCIERHGLKCNCGSRGCLETFAGNSYIVKEAVNRLKRGEKSILSKLTDGKLSEITPKLIHEASKKGDQFSIKVWQRMGENVGIGLSNIVNIFNPEVIVIGGGLAKSGKFLFDSIKTTVKARAMPIFTKDLKIKKAKFIEDAGTVGAAALVIDGVRNK